MKKFILSGFPRTGTTVIAGSILSNPNTLFYGEIFSNTPEVRQSEAQRITMGAGWKLDKQLDWGIPPCEYNIATKAYLDALYSRDVPFKAVGFKLMNDQALEGPNSDIWNYVAEHSDIKIIRTKRENPIEMVCSFVRASMTRRWHTTGEAVPNEHRFVVPPHEFLKLLERFQTLPKALSDIENTHQILELDYSRISSDFQACMDDVYSFLEVGSNEVSVPQLKKIARLKPSEELANYDELQKHFFNSQYEKYFIY